MDFYPNIMLAAGQGHTCILQYRDDNLETDNVAKCWGLNKKGQLGNGKNLDVYDVSSLSPIDFGLRKFATTISCGYEFTCAILDDDGIKCWGDNTHGQLGDGTFTAQNNPSTINTINLGPGRSAKTMTSGGYHTCSILDNDDIKCWGRNNEGQLGDETRNNRNIPTLIDLGSGNSAKIIGIGQFFTCVILETSEVLCWGDNSDGSLGDGTFVSRLSPSQSKILNFGPGKIVKQICCGIGHVCVLLNNNNMFCWGNNFGGQLGDGKNGAESHQNSIVNLSPVNLGPDRTANYISCNGAHSCAILTTNYLLCWGINDFGQLAIGLPDYLKNTPGSLGVIDLGNNRKTRTLISGHRHVCAVFDVNDMYCWGWNLYGQLGSINNNERVRSPVNVAYTLDTWSPTTFPTTRFPSKSPTTNKPTTKSPATTTPTQFPTTNAPTKLPTTKSPVVPTTPKPTLLPTTNKTASKSPTPINGTTMTPTISEESKIAIGVVIPLFAIFVLVVFFVLKKSKMKNEQDFTTSPIDEVEDANSFEPKSVCNHLFFISYVKIDALAETKMFRNYTKKHIDNNASIFHDTENHFKLSALINNVRGSKNVVVFLSPNYCDSPYCLIELVTAVRCRANIVVVYMHKPWPKGTLPFNFELMKSKLIPNKCKSSFMNPQGWKFLNDNGISELDVIEALNAVLNVKAFDFHVNSPDDVLNLEMEHIIQGLVFETGNLVVL